MATFTLHVDSGDKIYDGSARYTFNDAGLLVIDDGKGVRRVYAPHAWTSIETGTPEPSLRAL